MHFCYDYLMKVSNETKKTILAADLKTPTSLIAQSLGMLAYKTPAALLLKTRFGIHTLCMKYPIDVLILDKTNHIVKIKQTMQPNTYLLWNPKHNTVLELPEETIQTSQTKLNDKITY
jgi:uncharacterized membrane protein (UPF0127 family)